MHVVRQFASTNEYLIQENAGGAGTFCGTLVTHAHSSPPYATASNGWLPIRHASNAAASSGTRPTAYRAPADRLPRLAKNMSSVGAPPGMAEGSI